MFFEAGSKQLLYAPSPPLHLQAKMVFVDMNGVQFYQPPPAASLPSSQRIVPTVEERLMAAFQRRDGDELPRTSRENMRGETSDATAATKRISLSQLSPSYHV